MAVTADCHKMAVISEVCQIPTLVDPSAFFVNPKILTEISTFGMTSESFEIRRYAEDIVTYIMKCKIVVSDSVYNKVVETLIPSLPIIVCHISKNRPW
ncbi:hypothetical protein NQ317_012334 [Molorchus minor]|uniref:Uncharacterized protein n=1 Tax=Molorchus minor TaxID=1323400 RepID=A0ABQ9IS59_9CUCU|nr:hypothetical protein NQ317_012334 [Molorchus minor]